MFVNVLLRYHNLVDLDPNPNLVRTKNLRKKLLNMLQNGADPNEVDEIGQNALHVAVLDAIDFPLFKMILKKIKDINKQDEDGRTAFSLAMEVSTVEKVRELLKVPDIDVNLQDFNGSTPLMFAAEMENKDIISELLKRSDIDVTLRDNDGTTALDIATRNGFTYLIRLINERKRNDSIAARVVKRRRGTQSLTTMYRNLHLKF